MRKKINRIGQIFTTTLELGGYKFQIIDYVNTHNVTIQFLDEWGAIIKTAYRECEKGNIKNPYHPSVCGKGYLGTLPNGERPVTKVKGARTREYQMWINMIHRCYDPKVHSTHPEYANCSVCSEWLNYSNFLIDIPKIEGYELWIENRNYELDKDKKQPNIHNKVYNIHTCSFIHKKENIGEMNKRVKPRQNSKSVIGTHIRTGSQLFFNSIKEAENKMGISANSIRACCKGKKKDGVGEYIWSYANKTFDDTTDVANN